MVAEREVFPVANTSDLRNPRGERDITQPKPPLRGRIFKGDCLEVMRRFPEESIRLVVTSPPYNLKNSSGNGLKTAAGESGLRPPC